MKLKYWFGLSIALNVALAGLLLLGSRPPQTASPPAPSTTGITSVADSNSAAILSRREQSGKAAAAPAADWIQALRNAGVSEQVIADVAAADFENRWQQRSLANQKKFNRGEIDQEALARFDLEHDAEQEKDLRAALGDAGFRRWDQKKVLADFDRAGLELSASESDALYDLRKVMDRRRLELDRARLEGKADEDGAAEAMYTQHNEQLLKLLGDDRYAQLQSGGDTGLGELHRSLRAMKADETQVAGMETAQQNWNSQRSKLEIQLQKGEVTAEDYEKQLKAIEAQRDQDYQKALGADSFAEFQKTQDERYLTMKRAGPGLGFTDDDINNLYSTIQNYERGLRDYRERAQAVEAQGQPVDWPAVEQTLREYSQQTETALRASLGDKFDKLKRSNVLPFDR